MQVKPVQTMAQNKLLILYLINASGMQLSELQMVRIMGDLTIMQYFDLKECLFELEQLNDIYKTDTPGGALYGITEKGAGMLATLKDDLRLSFREKIDEYISSHKTKLIMESQFISEYIKLSENEYRVILKVLENSRTVFEINVIVYSKQEAVKMSENWQENAISLFKDVILHLN